jgi:aldose 1-epimerase
MVLLLLQDIVLGFDTVDAYWQKEYRAAYPYFGAIIGRTANRIKDGKFSLKDQAYSIAQNLNNDSLHGGIEGFDSKVWDIVAQGTTPNPYITLQYISVDMEEGFPGTVTTNVTYTLLENELQYEVSATTTKDTLVNITQHTYFNLNEDGDTIKTHKVKLHATTYLEQDAAMNTTGTILPVKDTIYDFTEYKHINRNWDKEQGYDQSFVLTNDANPLQLAAECWPMLRQCKLEIYTTEPIVHLYTGRWIPSVKGKGNIDYTAYSGLCFETQQHPNGINISNFPSAILKPGEQYYQKNSYKVVTIT